MQSGYECLPRLEPSAHRLRAGRPTETFQTRGRRAAPRLLPPRVWLPRTASLLVTILALQLAACGRAPEDASPGPAATQPPDRVSAGQSTPGRVAVRQARRKKNSVTREPSSDEPTPIQLIPPPDTESMPGESMPPDLMPVEVSPAQLPLAEPLPAEDLPQLAAAGIRRLEGTHLTLYTDLPSRPEVDELPHVYDAAVAPWCDYFHVTPGKAARWKMTGYLIERKERFQRAGLLPDDLPPFLNGFQRGHAMWIYEQPSTYYRRHLLLHEGTHAFMDLQLRGCGPPWYMEGMAELLGTHRWADGQLQLAYFPRHREDTPQWGRIKMIRDAVAAGRSMTLEAITAYGPTAHLENEPYAWCWAAAAFLDGHPQFSARFRRLPGRVQDDAAAFSAGFWQLFAADRRQLVEQWQLFIQQLDYGYDLQREAIVYEPPGQALTGVQEVQVRADRGWQSAGVCVAAGMPYVIDASGRYQVAREPRPWWCEPGGVTIRYYGGRPLGMLLAATSDLSQPLAGLSPLTRPESIGLGAVVTFAKAGTLFLRINDSPAELADNEGVVTVRIRRQE